MQISIMRHTKLFQSWLRNSFDDEDGAVTVDWVVITAAVVGLVIAISTTVGGAAKDHSELIDSTMVSQGIQAY